ncbi:putative J domain-containing protein [Escovopsis weberi]|uniref:Putative J domain-containing protein n=1 Tax=Escovopsis weberi TaxID=150374 RepID=A0A0M9VXI7_ESCWE|nr:putative J domain-containing protein [Escovopsis weberi]
MPDATASGADAGGASARSREHNQGNQGRAYTADQKAAVLRIRKCSPTAFYDILGLESVRASCSDADVKKAYRKQSLLTHPDKNGHEHADEAFKMVSRAFGVLGDKEKRDMYDRHGTDPDSRFASAQAQNPFAGFARGAGGGGGGGGRWDDEVSPEELFARFFGGGVGGGPFGGGGGFGGPQFVFNFGGGPGIRVHQFGGARPRARPRDAQAQAQQQTQSNIQTLLGLLPILIFFILPILSSLFSGGGGGGGGLFSGPSTPGMVYDRPEPPFTEGRTTPNLNVKYFVRPADVASYTKPKLNQLDRTAEVNLLRHLRNECDHELMHKQRLRDNAQGWFFYDEAKLAAAEAYPMPSCERLASLGVSR